MPSEYFIKNKAKMEFDKRGWVYWSSPKVKFYENDIFGCYDFVCVGKDKKKIKLFFIQLTTYKNMSARIKKVDNFLNNLIKKGLVLPAVSEVWGWQNKKKEFKIVRL